MRNTAFPRSQAGIGRLGLLGLGLLALGLASAPADARRLRRPDAPRAEQTYPPPPRSYDRAPPDEGLSGPELGTYQVLHAYGKQ